VSKIISTVFCLLLLQTPGLAQEKIKFPVGVSSKVLGYGHLWAAWRRGYFDREGFDAQVVLMRGTAPAVQALVGNSISAALLATDGTITAVEQGADLVMAASGSKITHFLIGAKNYKTYEDLRGATIGSSTLTSGTTFVLRRALKLKGLEYPRDYKLLSVGGTTEAFLAMNAGQTVASMMAVPYAFRAQEQGFNVIGKMFEVFPNYLLSSYSFRRSWAEKNRPVVVRFFKAIIRAKKWFEQDRKTAIEFLSKGFQLTPAHAEKGLDFYLQTPSWNPELEIEMDGLKTVVDIYAEQNNLKGPPPNPEKYVDQSYLRQALKELGLR